MANGRGQVGPAENWECLWEKAAEIARLSATTSSFGPKEAPPMRFLPAICVCWLIILPTAQTDAAEGYFLAGSGDSNNNIVIRRVVSGEKIAFTFSALF